MMSLGVLSLVIYNKIHREPRGWRGKNSFINPLCCIIIIG